MAYIGVSPSNGVRQKHTYTATANQTSFSGAGAEGISLSYLDSNYVDVYQNGVKLSEADYTSTTGTTVVLATGATVSDMIEIIVYDVFSVADTVSKADGGTFDGNVTMAGTLGVTGVVTANAGVVVDEMTIDGDTLTATDTFTIDSANIITLDSAFSSGDAGGIIRLADAGTQFGDLHEDSGNFLISSAGVDKDLIFKGNDGGAIITALTLDMSAGGTATFNKNVKLPDSGIISLGAGGDLTLTSDGTNGTIASPNGDLTIDVAGDIILDADGQQIIFADGGTQFGQISTNSTPADMAVKSLISDKDILFQGNDGGSTITALTLDMSEAGQAIFNQRGRFNGATQEGILTVASSTASMATTSNAHITLQNTNQTTGNKGLINYKATADSGSGFFPLAFGGRVTDATNAGRLGAFCVYVADTDNVDVDNDEHFRIAANGDITATDTSIGSNSDSRLKKDITDYTYDIEKFKKYEPKTFEWKNKEAHGNKENNRGFLAQDVKNVDDRWIEEIEVNKGNLDFDIIPDNISLTSKLGEKDAMYISVIQQLIARIETLENA